MPIRLIVVRSLEISSPISSLNFTACEENLLYPSEGSLLWQVVSLLERRLNSPFASWLPICSPYPVLMDQGSLTFQPSKLQTKPPLNVSQRGSSDSGELIAANKALRLSDSLSRKTNISELRVLYTRFEERQRKRGK